MNNVLNKLILLGFVFSSFNLQVIGQDLFPDQGEVFRDDVIPRIDIFIPQDSLTELFAHENQQSYHHYLADFIFNNGSVIDTFEDVGFRLRGNTSRGSDKKSFKVSFNTYEPGRKFYGLEKLNLNGEHNDPSVIRSKICWDLLRNMEVPASRSNHIDLFVNTYYFGTYINVEHVDEEFVDNRFGSQAGNLYKCLWPADLDYRGSNPDAYKFTSGDRRTYDLRTNTEEDDYSDLAHFIDVLNNTDLWDIPCELDKVLNIDNMIRAIAFDILSGNWDGPLYNKNNFYLYNNPSSGKFEYIPYDLDNTLGIDWLNRDWGTRDIYNWGRQGEARPLFYTLLSHPEHRNRLSFYLNEFIEKYFNDEHLFPYIDKIRTMITPGIIEDPFRPLDYDFSFQDFLNSYNNPLDNFHVQYGLKPYITTRMNTALQQLDQGNIRPIIRNPSVYREMNELIISAGVRDDQGIKSVKCCFSKDGGEWACFDLSNNGEFPDIDAMDEVYSGTFPLESLTGSIQYYIEAVDITDFDYRNPICSELEYRFSSIDNILFINEFMADNETIIADENDEFEDWIELYCSGPDSIFLGDKYVTDDRLVPNKFKLPNRWIRPEEFQLFWADNDEDQGKEHLNFKLSKSGEFVGLYDKIGNEFQLLHGVDFESQQEDISFGCFPDGSSIMEFLNPTPGKSNQPLNTIENKGDIFTVFPNPVKDIVTIHFSRNLDKQGYVYLADLNGRRIHCNYTVIDSNRISINMKSIQAGVYILHVLQNEILYSEKILKF